MEKRKEIAVEKLSKFSDTIITPINHRLSNPIIGSFFISWILVNWQPIFLLLFSDKSIEEKIASISNQYYGNVWFDILWYILVPLIVSLLYAFLLPRLGEFIEQYNLKPLKSLKKRIHELKIDEYINQLVYAEKQSLIENTKAEFKGIQDLNMKISLLQAEIDNKDKTIEEFKLDFENKLKQISDLEVALLNNKKDFAIQSEKQQKLSNKVLLYKYEVRIHKVGIRDEKEENYFYDTFKALFEQNQILIVNKNLTESGFKLEVVTTHSENLVTSLLRSFNEIRSFEIKQI